MILAIESSCDESALALFDPASGLCGEWIHSQIQLHQNYGGVVPDLASREHLKNFFPLLEASGVIEKRELITEIAVTKGPGLAGCLALGISFAKSLGLAWKLPVYGINHLRGHAFSPFIDLHAVNPVAFKTVIKDYLPHLGLIVSGGNTILFEINEALELKVLAETVDDAAGEALDKGAKLLGIPYPGGPEVERMALSGNPKAFEFPRAIAPRNVQRFSFSGLKTSLRYRMEKMSDEALKKAKPDLCASYQAAVIEQLTGKTRHVLAANHFKSLGLSGGVSNNKSLRSAMQKLACRYKLPALLARAEHTGDNAAMIAFAKYIERDKIMSNSTNTSTNVDALAIEPALRLDMT